MGSGADDNDAMQHAQNQMLKKKWGDIVAKRELSIVSKLVGEYRGDTLTPAKAFSAIAAIAELRSAVNDIG
jgi:hypothetical protein